ncbi:MAG: PAS domain-containing protein [Gammaproteobacteria bacterium]|nr:PAS domain-containing protein [Gammaproteobacteria bacterium]
MGYNKFSIMIATQTVIIMLLLMLLTYLINIPGYYASILFVTLLLISQCIFVYRFVTKTNQELSRFFDAARHADYSQRFELKDMGAGFGELSKTFSDILRQFQENRTSQAKDLRYLKAIIEQVPVPLIAVNSDESLTLWNNSARRLFGANHVKTLNDLKQFGEDFVHQINSVRAGERRLVNFLIDGMELQLTISATEIVLDNRQEKLLSLLDIQSELDGAQFEAWQGLVRVLTHEIMNSITPVASLAKTAVDLIDDARLKVKERPDIVDELTDVSNAVQTVARRSDGLMNFVGSYRRLTRLPLPDKKTIKIKELFDQVIALATQEWEEKNIALQTKIEPTELDINIDKNMIEQLLINLLLNAEHAVAEKEKPEICMQASLNRRGHVVIDVSDNGAGIADEIVKKIFVPFFTTKREGSGVGLALTRQVMIAHGGTVQFEKSTTGGALFRLTF